MWRLEARSAPSLFWQIATPVLAVIATMLTGALLLAAPVWGAHRLGRSSQGTARIYRVRRWSGAPVPIGPLPRLYR